MSVSIVTINLNNKDGLLKTIRSVVNQSIFNDIEYIVIDGGSTDGSLDVIEEYKDYFSYWVSEPDGGIFNAFNKALKHLTGEYVLFLNSGDYLVSDVIIEKVIKHLDADIVYGDMILDKGKKVIILTYKRIEKQYDIRYPDKIDEGFFKVSALPHQCTFIKTSYQKEHPYSEEYTIVGDWIFFREAVMRDKVSYKHIPIIISHFEGNGISSNQELCKKEKQDYYKKNK